MENKFNFEEPKMTENHEDLVKPIFQQGRYKNPFDTYEDRNFSHFIRLMKTAFFNDKSDIPGSTEELNRTLPIKTPDFDKLNNPPADKMQIMWVGHASVLVQFDGITVLTDPVWGSRCGPLGVFGPKRYRKPPCKIEDLPPVDAVVISHNHYDHLCNESVTKLNRKFGPALRWYVAMGQADWMRKAGCENVVEMTWWQEHVLEKGGKTFMFASTPNQHWCKRTATDTNKALWCSWVVKGPSHSFYFAGDTGYCSAFEQIGQKYGPFSLAALPIGAYEPRWFMRPQHVNPEEAVTIHKQIRARKSLGIHWGTFRLTIEHYLEPREKLKEILSSQGMDAKCFFTLAHGEVNIVDAGS